MSALPPPWILAVARRWSPLARAPGASGAAGRSWSPAPATSSAAR